MLTRGFVANDEAIATDHLHHVASEFAGKPGLVGGRRHIILPLPDLGGLGGSLRGAQLFPLGQHVQAPFLCLQTLHKP